MAKGFYMVNMTKLFLRWP